MISLVFTAPPANDNVVIVTPGWEHGGMPTEPSSPASLEAAAARLAALLTGQGAPGLADRDVPAVAGRDREFEAVIGLRPLARSSSGPPADVWAVDGGQAMVADARCLQLLVTRAS